MKNFTELNLSPALATAIEELGYTTPTPIQAQALPLLLEGPTDFLGLAATGTGKTAAFGIPLLEQLNQSRRDVQALVLCPTRELAIQVTEQLNLLAKHKKIKALPIYGGAGYGDQLRGLKQGIQIVVATPGRLIDHIERGTIKLDKIQTVILDEADEMISMGFKDEIESILEAIPAGTYNTWLFSATMNRDVRRVADRFLKDPKQVQVNKTEMLSGTVQQIYYKVRESDKADILCKLIDASEEFYGLIFCQTKSLVADLTTLLNGRGYKVDCLHGDKDQNQRERTMRAFRERRVGILVCTDVASRGLDVKDLTHVINFSIPRELDSYVHRIGRTGRSGKPGLALSLVTPSHMGLIGRIEKMTMSKMIAGVIPTRRDIGVKKTAKILERFHAVDSHKKAAELLGDTWVTAIEEMDKMEIVARFLAMSHPDLFSEQEKSSAAQLPGSGIRPVSSVKINVSTNASAVDDTPPWGARPARRPEPRPRSSDSGLPRPLDKPRPFEERGRERGFGDRNFGDRGPSNRGFGDRDYSDRSFGERASGHRGYSDRTRPAPARESRDRRDRPARSSQPASNERRERRW